MKTRGKTQFARSKMSLAVAALFAAMGSNPASALTINVVGSDGLPVTNYRWLVEEDATKASVPGLLAGAANLSLGFHTSYMPVLNAGNSTDPAKSPANLPLDPTKRYYVSVLPDSGYQMGGAPVAEGQTSVTVRVVKAPVPTAQISLFVFNDNQPINGAPDMPQETGLGSFTVTLKEAGGTYGASGGQVTLDAFGNPIGTTYQQNPNGTYVLDAGGNPVVQTMGTGFLKTAADGTLLIKNLAPAKYTIEVIPPAGSGWVQTSTIEGTKGIDAWVKANEPATFQEFGPPGHHVFVGFVNAIRDTSVLTGGSTITGKVVNMHSARPPDFAFYNGEPFPQCRIGLNELPVAGGKAVFTAPCNPDSTFSIPGVPPGTYQLVIWDDNLDILIASTNVTVPQGGADVDLQEVPVFSWFARLDSRVFFDANNNGFRDPGETGLGGQAVNIRFRDGSIYQAQATDPNGETNFSEVFPFFHWLVAEVDFARFKATGATIVADDGGPVPADAGWAMPSWGKLNPQPQSENAGAPYRTETGQVLLQGIQTFLSQTNVIEWGKNNYGPGENGGISGIVHYATTRAENDPRLAAADNWEPGIPRIQVALYKDANGDNIIDDLDGDGAATPTDVDHMPLGNFPGPEDVDHNANGLFDRGDAMDVVYTDSWDDSVPTGCQGTPFVSNGVTTDCFDGLRNFNQVRPAVFDGGYAFAGLRDAAGNPVVDAAGNQLPLPAGKYIVESMAPPGYQTVKEEDKNVDFGDAYTPGTLVLPPVCVGDPHAVPAELALFPGIPAPFAGQTRPLCDRKSIDVAQGKNAAVDFFMFTEVPVAAHISGMILDDTSNEFDPNAPTFGEKHAPAWLPVSIRDWTGAEISRVYADQWGKFNALVPSSYSVNIPMPSGLSPNMITTCMNDPGPIPDPATGQLVIDPNFDRQYSQFCYTFQYLPGKTTYLDTPVLPVAAFAGPGQYPVDCEFSDGTPVVYTVNGKATSNTGGAYVSQNGPYVPQRTVDQTQLPTLTIVSAGTMNVPNPAYDGTAATAKFVARDFGFGAGGTVTVGGAPVTVKTWTPGLIEVEVPFGTPTGELVVTRADTGKSSLLGVTVTVGGKPPIRVAPGGSIQAAIDQAATGDLILVAPGRYDELVVMNKKVRLQGWGALATNINAAKVPAEKLTSWRAKVNQLYAAGQFDLVPGQAPGANMFGTEEGPGILVVAKQGAFTSTNRARIDGVSISGGDTGGAIFVNGFAKYLEISNNKIFSNNGLYGGGIRIGHPTIEDNSADNDYITIHNNQIAQNGGMNGAGGGVSIYAGTQVYDVRNNYICGNFSAGNGGGIGHLGGSNRGVIANNTVIFNQSFNQGTNVSGGGIFVGGQAPANPGTLSLGSGNVTVSGNLVQGNLAGAGDGGGIAAQFVNGQDVTNSRNYPTAWYKLTLENNMVVDNVAGMAGGGVALQDVVVSTIANNTVADNQSTATAGAAFAPGSPNQSTPQPAGIISRAHSTLLYNTIGTGTAAKPYKLEYANPTLVNNVVWHNKSSYWAIDPTTLPATFALHDNPAGAYWDLAVMGTTNPADKLNPTFSILTDATGYGASNTAADPRFVNEVVVGPRGQTIIQPGATVGIETAPAFDEGGNWIDVRFGLVTPAGGQLTPAGNFHLQAGSPAIDQGTQITGVTPATDIDGQGRTAPLDIGADEAQ